MSYDLDVFSRELPFDLIPAWLKRLNAIDQPTYEIHPDVTFEFGLSGFCPFKVTTAGRWPFSAAKSYISGFELFVAEFDFNSYFDLEEGGSDPQRQELVDDGLDLDLWEQFRTHVSFSFNANHRFEAELAFLSAAILTETLNGLCDDPQTGETLDQTQVFEWATERVTQVSSDRRGQPQVSHPFEGWN